MSTPVQSAAAATIADHGEALRGALGDLLDAIPDTARSPTLLARALDVNRVIVSRVLNALKREDPLEVLQHLPGPDSLRSITKGAAELEPVPRGVIERANESIEGFGSLIRDRFGTRGALNAAISDESQALRRRYEESARYEVYSGMRHLMGVEGETWLTAMIFAPSPEEDFLAVTTLHGVVGMRRLRPDTPVHFTFGPPPGASGEDCDPLATPIALQEFYVNEPAPLETEVRAGQLVHSLRPYGVGKDAIVDMLAVSHDPRGSRRHATPGRRLAGAAIFNDVPVRTLHCDAFVHESVFRGSTPRVIVYNPGARGPANPNDPSRDVDRVDADEPVAALACEPAALEAPGIPHYPAMIGRVFGEIGQRLGAYRVFRVRIAYPVQGFQYVLAFEPPLKP